MADINKKVSILSPDINDLHSAINTWLKTSTGKVFKLTFDIFHQDLFEGKPLTAAHLKKMIGPSATRFSETFMAPNENVLHQVNRGGASRIEFCDDGTFKDLVKTGNHVTFLMNAWVHVSVQLGKDQVQRLHKAFHQPFLGKNVDWIEEGFTNYKNMYVIYRHYGRIVPVIQSSGMGKSRTMAEWAKRRLILSICLRDILGEMQSGPCIGWPPGDKPVCKFFASPPQPTDPGMKEFKGEELAGAFLGAFYTVVADLLQKTTLSEPEDLQTFYASWVFDDPTNIEESPRHKTFTKVCEIAEQLLEKNEVMIRENRGIKEKKRVQSLPQSGTEAANSLPQDRGQFDEEQQAQPQGRVAWYDSIFTLLVKEKGEELMETCRKSKLSSDFIVVLDECDELNRCNKGSSDSMSLISLLRIIKAGEEHNIWFFPLETSSGIFTLLPRMEVEASPSRLFGFTLLPPWVHFKYDVMLPSRVRPTKPCEAMSLDYMKWYGRPYWSTLQHSDLLTAAEQKLLNNEYELNTLNYAHILLARLALKLETNKASAWVAIQSVRSPMRILTELKDSHTMTTCAPSEPVLAAAAASLLLKDKWKYKAAVEMVVKSMIPQGVLVDKGRRNELAARILLMLARDSAVLKNGFQTIYEIPAITLCEFLDALLGKKMAIPYFPVEQQKVVRDDLREWAYSHYLNFTHFIQLTETFHALSADFLMECWCRGVALVCSSGQPVFDILLITYKGKFTDPFDKSLFGLVSIQVGLRETPAPSRVVDLLTCPIVLIEGGDEHRKPDYLAIFMDLGATQEFDSDRPGVYCYLSHESAKQSGTRDAREVKNSTQNWQGYVGENEPSRYCINIRYHTCLQYAVIEDLGPALNHLWDDTSPYFGELVDEMEFSLDPFRGKLLATTESWFDVQSPHQEGMDVDL